MGQGWETHRDDIAILSGDGRGGVALQAEEQKDANTAKAADKDAHKLLRAQATKAKVTPSQGGRAPGPTSLHPHPPTSHLTAPPPTSRHPRGTHPPAQLSSLVYRGLPPPPGGAPAC